MIVANIYSIRILISRNMINRISNLLIQKLDIKLISESTGLSVEEMKKLEKEING